MADLNHIRTDGNIFGIALNYKSLYSTLEAQFSQSPYLNPPQSLVLFIKPPNTRNHSGAAIIKRAQDILQAGPSVGIVIAKPTVRIHAAQAGEHIAGYVVVNELSLPEESYYRPAIKAKCQDGFCVLSQPVAKLQITNINNLELRVFVNGELKQTGNTGDWIKDPEQIIAEISEYMPLNAGDIVLTGTPAGRVNLYDGDWVRIEIDQLGAVENQVVEQGV